jgi:hypothetical protein
MGVELATVVALVAILALASWTALEALRRRRALADLVGAAQDLEGARRAATSLPMPERELTAQFLEGVSLKSTLDEALARAMVRAANELEGPPIAARLARSVALSSLAFAPLSLALLGAGSAVVELQAETTYASRATVYLLAPAALEGPFAEVLQGARATALLLALLTMTWAARWWLLRPAAREATFVRALLECSVRLRPGVPAAVSAGLATATAPDRALSRPALATAVFVLAATLGVTILDAAAPARARRQLAPSFSVWPGKRVRPFEVSPPLSLPTISAGAPIGDQPRPTLRMGPQAVTLEGVALAELSAGRLPPEWRSQLPDLTGAVEGFPRPLDMSVVADASLPLDSVLALLEGMHARLGASRFFLITERARAGVSGLRAQAELHLELGPAPAAPTLVLELRDGSVRVAPGNGTWSLASEAWRSGLREVVRKDRTLFTADVPAPVVLVPDRGLSYGRLVEVLAVADGACSGEHDCGLPGLGLTFLLVP